MSIYRMALTHITVDYPNDPRRFMTTEEINYAASVFLPRAVVHIDELKYVEAQSETRS